MNPAQEFSISFPSIIYHGIWIYFTNDRTPCGCLLFVISVFYFYAWIYFLLIISSKGIFNKIVSSFLKLVFPMFDANFKGVAGLKLSEIRRVRQCWMFRIILLISWINYFFLEVWRYSMKNWKIECPLLSSRALYVAFKLLLPLSCLFYTKIIICAIASNLDSRAIWSAILNFWVWLLLQVHSNKILWLRNQQKQTFKNHRQQYWTKAVLKFIGLLCKLNLIERYAYQSR